jgi:hypothetical protein
LATADSYLFFAKIEPKIVIFAHVKLYKITFSRFYGSNNALCISAIAFVAALLQFFHQISKDRQFNIKKSKNEISIFTTNLYRFALKKIKKLNCFNFFQILASQ